MGEFGVFQTVENRSDLFSIVPSVALGRGLWYNNANVYGNSIMAVAWFYMRRIVSSLLQCGEVH